MKKILSLFISFLMLFNLTADIFAQQLGFNTNKKPSFGLGNSKTNDAMKRMKQEHEEFKTYMNALDKRIKYPDMYKNEPPGTAKLEAQMEILDKKLDKSIIESVPDKERAVAAKLGANFYDFKNALEGQEDVDLGASWRAYCKDLAGYYEDYTILIRKFPQEDRSYMDIVSDIPWILRNRKTGEKFGYEGRDYDVEAYLHACVHNLVTRTTTGYTQRGPWVWSKEEPEAFSLEDKIDSMSAIYEVVSRYGYYPEDREFIWLFAYDIVKNGKKYFDNDTYKADILPGLSNADDRQKRDHGKDDRNKQANAVSIAMAILPLVSDDNSGDKFSNKKSLSISAIYNIMTGVLGIISTYDYASVAILTGARALIAFDSSDSLSKLLTFLTEDCKKSFAKGAFDFAMGVFSTESWAKGISRVADKNGGYAYNNSLTSQFTYMDKNKTDNNTAFFAEGSVRENYFNAVYTNIFEEIGRELGLSSRSSSKADSYVTTFASRLSNKGFNGNFSDDDLSASIVVGILDTAAAGNTSLNYAADLIYSGAWFDLNEATQRDKNNIAAAYLGKPKKEYNQEKDDTYKQMMSVQDTGKYMDIAVNAVMITSLVASAPAILRSMANFTGKAISRVKTITGVTKNVKLSTAAKVSKVTPRSYTGAATTAPKATTTAPKATTTAPKATTTAPKAATTAPKAATTAPKAATTAPKATTTAANAEKTAATATTAKPAPTAEETLAANKAQIKSDFNNLSEKLFGKFEARPGSKAVASTLVPVPGMQYLMGGTFDLPSLTQLINRNPAVRAIFNSSESKVMKLMETEGLSAEKVKSLFLEDFSKGLTESSLVPATQRANIIEETSKALGVAFDGSKAAAAAATTAAEPAKVLSMEEKIRNIKKLTEYKVDITTLRTNGLLEDAYYSKIESLASKGVKETSDFLRLKTKGFLDGENFAKVESLTRRGFRVTGRNFDDLMLLKQKGFLEGEKFAKLDKLLDLEGVDNSTILKSIKSGFFEEPIYSRFIESIPKSSSKNTGFFTKDLLSDANYPKTKALLDNGVDIKTIWDFNREGILDAKYAELTKNSKAVSVAAKTTTPVAASATSAAPTQAAAKAKAMTSAEKLSYLEEKGISGWELDAWEKDIVNASGAQFERAQALIDKGLDPSWIYTNRSTLLSDANFAEFEKMVGTQLSPEEFRSLSREGLFAPDGRGDMTMKMLKQNHKPEKIIKYYTDRELSHSISHYANNADKELKAIDNLMDKGWSWDQALKLEYEGFAPGYKNYSNLESVLGKDVSKQDAFMLVDEGLLGDEYFAKVSKFLEYKVTPSEIKNLKLNGVLKKDLDTLEYLLLHKANSKTILKLNEEGLLDNFARTKIWLKKGFNFDEMKLLRKITKDFNSTDIAAQVDLLVEKGFNPTQIDQLWKANKLNNNLERIQTLLDKGADFDALMKYLN